MDDVTIPTTNAVKPVFSSSPPTGQTGPAGKPAGTFVNFFFMLPLAVIVLLQGFFLGKSIGEYTTFPVFTLQTYFAIGMIGVLLLIVQFFLRSIIYSTAFGLVLTAGIFSTWFGDFITPITANFREIIGIFKAAMSKRDAPYSLLVSAVLTGILFVVMVGNFIASLFVKYFFEITFGREWSDGRRTGFVTAMIFLLMVQGGMTYLLPRMSQADVIRWQQFDRYNPLEEYIVRIPSGAQLCGNRVVVYDPHTVASYDADKGTLLKKNPDLYPHFPALSWTRLDFPIIPAKLGLIAFDPDLDQQKWLCGFPVTLSIASLAERLNIRSDDDAAGSGSLPENLGVPVVVRTDIAKDYIIAFFDYGIRGVIAKSDGKLLWADILDAPLKVNRLFLEEFITSDWTVEKDGIIVFSGYNGKLTAVEAKTGKILWDFSHKDAKYAGKGQKALLSLSGTNVLAAFPSGSINAFDLAKGTKVYEARTGLEKWSPISPAYLEDREAGFISSDGSYVRLELDGGKVLMKQDLFVNRPPLMPAPYNLRDGFVGYRDQIFTISSSTKSIQPVFQFSKHIFVTPPIVSGDFLYFGTQDGWVFCLHRESYHVKWKTHVGGELTEESLIMSASSLLVRTKSGSVYSLRPGP
jgi:hypothetical protein